MKSDNKRRRRTVPKNATAPASASRAGKPKPRVRLSGGASMAVRDTGAKQPSKGRQRIKSKSSGRLAKSVKPTTAKKPLSRVYGKGKPRRPRLVNIALRERDERATQVLAAIVDSSDAAIIGKTLDGMVTSWNRSAERIFGYTASEMIGKSIDAIAAPSRPREMAQILARIRHGQRIEHYETERVQKDGRVIQVSLTGFAYP
jgi:PAS domain S-box-containing protein